MVELFEVNGTRIRLTQGDSGLLTIDVSGVKLTENDRAVFSMCKALRGDGRWKKMGAQFLEAVLTPDVRRGVFQMPFVSSDTEKWPAGRYLWDVRVVLDAVETDGRVTDGREVFTPFPPGEMTIERTVGMT